MKENQRSSANLHLHHFQTCRLIKTSHTKHLVPSLKPGAEGCSSTFCSRAPSRSHQLRARDVLGFTGALARPPAPALVVGCPRAGGASCRDIQIFARWGFSWQHTQVLLSSRSSQGGSSRGSQATVSPFPSCPRCLPCPSPRTHKQWECHPQGCSHPRLGVGAGLGPCRRWPHTYLPAACCCCVPSLPAMHPIREGLSLLSPLMGIAAAVTASTRWPRECAGSAQIQP